MNYFGYHFVMMVGKWGGVDDNIRAIDYYCFRDCCPNLVIQRNGSSQMESIIVRKNWLRNLSILQFSTIILLKNRIYFKIEESANIFQFVHTAIHTESKIQFVEKPNVATTWNMLSPNQLQIDQRWLIPRSFSISNLHISLPSVQHDQNRLTFRIKYVNAKHMFNFK